jgi:hypothetical protein
VICRAAEKPAVARQSQVRKKIAVRMVRDQCNTAQAA